MFLTAKRVALVGAAALAAVCAPVSFAQPANAPAAAAPAEPAADLGAIVGEWTIAIDGLPGGPQLGTIVAKKEGDGVAATISTPLGEVQADEVKVDGPNHVVVFFIDAMGQSMDVQATSKIAGDTFEGSLLVGGGMMEAGLKGAKTGSAAETELKAWVEQRRIEIIGEPELPVAEAKDFMGAWMFQGDSPMGGPMEIEFELVDAGGDYAGKASGQLKLPPPLGTQTINRMKREGESLVMSYEMEFAGQPMEMLVDMSRKGPLLTGLIDVGGGLFQIPLEGVRAGRGFTKTTIGGKNITVEYGRPSTSGGGFKQLESLKEGFVWRLGKDDVTVLSSDADLKFGDKTIPAGSYGLLAKRVGGGWSLVLNKQNEGHPMKRKAEDDLAEIPTEKSVGDQDAELLTITLSQAEGQGVIKIHWGKEVATAKFDVVLPEPPAAAGAAK